VQNNISKSLLTLSLVAFLLQAGPGQQAGGGGAANPGGAGATPTGDLVILGDGAYPRANHAEKVEKLKSVNFENTSNYSFELAGQTSVNLKGKALTEGQTSGTFVTRNEAANANVEIAYFNLARILGVDNLFRATVPYKLGPHGCATFKAEIGNPDSLPGAMKRKNARNILAMINSNPNELKGCLREKKNGETVAINSLASTANNRPSTHALLQDLQASAAKPADGRYTFSEGYWGPKAKLAQQYSIMMTFDTVFGQWDRYSGSNIVFRIVDENTKEIEVYSSDNGGADFWNTTSWAQKQASWFGKYDRKVIEGLRSIYAFLKGQSSSLRAERLGKTYTNVDEFIVDLGLYYEKRPSQYAAELAANIKVLLTAVEANKARYGEDRVFF